MLTFQACQKSFGKNKVLQDVTLDIPANSLFGFAGINGAGKTTLIKCLLDLLHLDSGSIIFDNHPFRFAQVYRDIGYLPEVFQPPHDLTGQEFLHYCYQLIKKDSNRSHTVKAALETVGLASSARQRIRKLSKGMRQRLGIAQAIIHQPRLLILDEPFSGLDPIGRYDLKQLFRQLRQSGTTIFFSSHNLIDLQDLCSHVAVLHDGRIAASDTVDKVLTRYQTNDLEQAFLQAIGYQEAS
ncbi:ABC transporter ATP-binding protein [Candidatus Margulisiibacteriota bacterium]